MKYINIGNKVVIELHSSNSCPAYVYIQQEYKHHLTDTDCGLPIVGIVDVDNNLRLPIGFTELRKNILNEFDSSLFIGKGRAILKINATPDLFTITLGKSINNEIAFFTLEILIRFYIPKYGIIFMHTAGFIYNDKLSVINAFGGVGKTEVMLGAVEEGADFIADDFAIFNADGEVYPYTKRIYLCEYPYTDKMLQRTRKNKWLYKLKCFCDKRHDPISTRLSSRLELNYFGTKIDYTDVCQKETPLRYYKVDNFYWADSSDKTGLRSLTSEYFKGKMKLCLDIESRKYFDYEGYLRLQYPFLNEYKAMQSAIVDAIAEKMIIQGLTIRNHNFEELIDLVLKLNNNK